MSLDKQTDHEIRVKVEEDPNGASHAVLEMPNGGLHVGQSVSYVSDDSFSLEFPDGSLFGATGAKVVSNSEILTLVKEGRFECRCSITPASGPPIQWTSSDPKSGGAHDVQR
jgi:hypothetical protein